MRKGFVTASLLAVMLGGLPADAGEPGFQPNGPRADK